MRRVWIFFLFLGIISTGSVFAQRKTKKESFNENHNPFGKRKKEKKNQKIRSKRGGGLFKKNRSKGNADNFATHRITGSKGFFASLFTSKHSSNASLRKTKPIRKNEDSKLYKRQRTKAKHGHRSVQQKQNRKRERTRKRGNVLFSKKKH